MLALLALFPVFFIYICNFFQGLGEGVTTPSMSSLLGQWAPPPERSTMATGEDYLCRRLRLRIISISFMCKIVFLPIVTYGGTQMGTIIGLPLAGLLCQSSYFGGWQSVFYIYGTLGVLWFLCWTAFCFDDPDSHPRISGRYFMVPPSIILS